MRLVPEPPEAALPGDVAGAGVVTAAVVAAGGMAVAVTVAVAVGGTPADVSVAIAVGVVVVVAVGVAVLLCKLPIALLTLLPHPATRQPATRMATGREEPLIVHRMLVLPHGPVGSRTLDDPPAGPALPHPPGGTLRAAPSPLAALRPAGTRSSARGRDRRAPWRDQQRARRDGGRRPGRGDPAQGLYASFAGPIRGRRGSAEHRRCQAESRPGHHRAGAGNLASGFLRGIAVGGSVGQTALNVIAGARTRWAAIWSGLWLLIILVIFSGLVAKIAVPVLGAILIFAAIGSLTARMNRSACVRVTRHCGGRAFPSIVTAGRPPRAVMPGADQAQRDIGEYRPGRGPGHLIHAG